MLSRNHTIVYHMQINKILLWYIFSRQYHMKVKKWCGILVAFLLEKSGLKVCKYEWENLVSYVTPSWCDKKNKLIGLILFHFYVYLYDRQKVCAKILSEFTFQKKIISFFLFENIWMYMKLYNKIMHLPNLFTFWMLK